MRISCPLSVCYLERLHQLQGLINPITAPPSRSLTALDDALSGRYTACEPR